MTNSVLLSRRSFSMSLVGLLLCSCASRPVSGALVPTDKPAPGAKDHKILIATTRSRTDTPNTLFDGERSGGRDFAQAVISVPPTHVSGAIEWPAVLPGDPAKEMVPRSTGYLEDATAFRQALKSELAARPPKDRSVMLFIHGYNTLFAEGLYRFTQVVHDSAFPGVPVLFTWASRGDVRDYVYDLNSATVARDELQATLEDLAASGAAEINILAHSMGTWLLMETLRQMTPAQRSRINQVVLAAPDIDLDVFKDQMQRIGKLKSPLILLLSRDDRALGVSRLIAGGMARVGGYDDDAALAKLGAVVVDLTDLKGPDPTNHSKFAALAAIAPQLSSVLGQNKLDVPNGDGGALASTGRTLGSFVTGTVNIAVTLPVTLVTTPVEIVMGGR